MTTAPRIAVVDSSLGAPGHRRLYFTSNRVRPINLITHRSDQLPVISEPTRQITLI